MLSLLALFLSLSTCDDFYPPRPTVGPTTPPIPSSDPEPQHIFFNSSHYISYDLSIFPEKIQEFDSAVMRVGQSVDVHFKFSSWNTISCPSSYDCAEFSSASAWICWKNQSNCSICFPVAHSGYEYSLAPLNLADISKGAIVLYNGFYGVQLRLRTLCRSTYASDSFTFDDGFVLTSDPDHIIYDVIAYSRRSCITPFADSNIPSYTPSPTPAPKKITFKKIFQAGENGMMFDLTNLSSASAASVVGLHNTFEKSEIYFYPYVMSTCPSGYQCVGFGAANVWNCIPDSKKCYSIGVSSYGLSIDNVSDVITVRYGGGIGGTSALISFSCNTSLPISSVVIKPVVKRYSNGTFAINADSGMGCKRKVETSKDSMTFGGFFLLTVSSLIAIGGYFDVVYRFWKSGNVRFPYEDQLSYIISLFISALGFLFSCGSLRRFEGRYSGI